MCVLTHDTMFGGSTTYPLRSQAPLLRTHCQQRNIVGLGRSLLKGYHRLHNMITQALRRRRWGSADDGAQSLLREEGTSWVRGIGDAVGVQQESVAGHQSVG